jgi:hypothetical protein
MDNEIFGRKKKETKEVPVHAMKPYMGVKV